MSAYKSSVGGETEKIFTRIFVTDMNTAWQSALEGLKTKQLDISNREGGTIQTRWTDNTSLKNFVDSFGETPIYLKAQYRFKISLTEGFYNGRSAIKLNILKEQLVQRDILEGWYSVETDGIEEKTLLYRVGRIIYIRMKVAKLEKESTERALQDFESEGVY